MSNSKTVVCALEGKVVLISEHNPDFGNIRVCQIRTIFDETGWARKKKLYALVPGTVEVLNDLGWKEGDELPGKIVVKESLTPFNKKDPDKDLKIAGDSGIVCKKDGKPIYLKPIYTEVENAADSPVPHDNIAEIREAYAKKKVFANTGPIENDEDLDKEISKDEHVSFNL